MTDINEKVPVAPATDDPEAAASSSPAESLKQKLEASSVAPPPVGVEHVVVRDGIRLHPQPTSDPMDPLNWTFAQKREF